MVHLELALIGGLDNGPLFAPLVKVRAPRPRMQSTYRDRVIKRRTPAWACRRQIRAIYDEAKRQTKKTGIVHSVDHIVPLSHPLVSGLHCPANLRVIPLAENIMKSNNEWPDMPQDQGELF